MNHHLHALAFAAIGSLLQELAHWSHLRRSLKASRYYRLLKSRMYWSVTVLLVIGSAVGTLAWYFEDPQTARAYLLTGAAFPLILKKAISALTSRKTMLGNDEAASASEYFS
jgi:hypothetical protein